VLGVPNRVDWKNTRQLRLYIGLLWGLTVFGTLAGFVVQSILCIRAWSSISEAILPVFSGASIGYGLILACSVLRAKRSRATEEHRGE